MSVQFSGWEVVDDGASFPGVALGPLQMPQKRGIYTMYHGTSVASARLIIANGFTPSASGMLGKGVYVSRDKKKAERYPLKCKDSDRVIFELRVRVGRVKRIDKNDSSMQFTWQLNGYNTAWIPPACGLPFVPKGLEEDCVFDPKRVEVVGIESAPNTSIQTELQQLLAQKKKKRRGGVGGTAGLCSLCKRKTQHGSQHIKQKCWKCGQNICTLMSKHFCPCRMSVQFTGWEVTYDDDSPRSELGASHTPKDRGVYTMYHGTKVDTAKIIIANGFTPSADGMLGKGVYVSRDKKKAERYPLKSNPADRVVLELQVRVGRVKRIDKDQHPMQKSWSSQGYDTAWVPPNCGMKAVPSGLEEDCVFDPKRVKVVGIARAHNQVLSDLQQLVDNSLMSGGGGGAVCSLCRRKQQHGSAHISQPCWGCGKNICTFMKKHFCSGRN
ncbi:uncharacterized protein [Embiotoca jacksoni]|uniref:uncharacterized protein n=1 Tax=Embiotoca jacksoni TaxID=100190 RepID=UPI003704CCEB